jgi:O-antigen/teichoic acid export membrane protein
MGELMLMDASGALHNARSGLSRLVRSRLSRGVGANAYSQAVSLLIQFGSVPLLISAWGAHTFGLWLVISAIPSYLALADFGFSGAAGNDMTLATARGAHAEARAVFQSVLALNGLVSLGVVAIVLMVVLLIPSQFLPQSSFISNAEVRFVWVLQTIQVAATLCCGAFGAGFQASGRYAFGVFLGNSARFIESVALVAGALLFHHFAAAAALMLAVRLAALAVMAIILIRGVPWLRLGFRYASLAQIRRLTAPALAAAALLAAFAISLQGFVLVIGATLSLDAVAVFSTVRTLTRTPIQAGNVVNLTIMPEVTRAFGAGDLQRTRRLIRLNLTSAILLNATAFAVIVIFGSRLVTVWTRGHVIPDPVLVIGLAAVAALHSFWLLKANLVLAVNRHAGYSYWFVAVSVASTLAAIPATLAFGLKGVLLPLLLAECIMIVIVELAYRRTFDSEADRGPPIIRRVASP